MGTVQTDSAGNSYIEVALPNGDRLRVTLVRAGWAGTPGVRIQLRDGSGHLRQGPEVPADSVGPLVGAVVQLLSSQLGAAQTPNQALQQTAAS